MTTNPILNALGASLYIIGIVNLISLFEQPNTPDKTIFVPVAMLSLFTLSAAVMGYLFVYQPLRLFLEGQKSQAVTLFLQTVGVFAVLTALIFLALYAEIFA